LASDYVRTFTDLATMEAANEAARRAVNGVLRAARADVAPCEVWNLHEPEVFLPLRAHDRMRYRKGLAWDGEAVWFAQALLQGTLGGSAMSGIPGVDGRGSKPTSESPDVAAAGAGRRAGQGRG